MSLLDLLFGDTEKKRRKLVNECMEQAYMRGAIDYESALLDYLLKHGSLFHDLDFNEINRLAKEKKEKSPMPKMTI
jgi:hypothetical protein